MCIYACVQGLLYSLVHMRTRQDFVSFKDEAASITQELQPSSTISSSSSATAEATGSGHTSSSSEVMFATMTRDILEDLQFYNNSTSATNMTLSVVMSASSSSEEKALPEIVFEAGGVFLEGSNTAYIHRHQMLTLYQEYFGHNSDSASSIPIGSAFASSISLLGLTLLGEGEVDRSDILTSGHGEASAAALKAHLLSLLTDLDTYESLHTQQVTTCRAKDTERGCAIIPDYKLTNPVAKGGVEEVDIVVKAANYRLREIRCLIEEVKKKYTLI